MSVARLACALEDKYGGAYNHVPPWWRRFPSILVHAWFLRPQLVDMRRYLYLTLAEWLADWSLMSMSRWASQEADVRPGLMFHNGYRLFDYDVAAQRWVQADGVFK